MLYMIILIDAYNVLKSLYTNVLSPQQQAFYVQLITNYAKRKGHVLILVFDGGPFFNLYKIKEKHVETVYSGKNAIADDVIKQYINEYQYKDLLVVSSDREIRTYAERHDVTTIDSFSFNEYVQTYMQSTKIKQVPQTNPLHKLDAGHKNPLIDQLMQEYSQKIIKNVEPESSRKQLQEIGQSKKERKRLKQLQKL
jgi:predicted RNA-binding protein with PIN domain